MAKRQTRRSISLAASIYKAVFEVADELGQSASAYVTELIQDDLKDKGRQVPETRHYGAKMRDYVQARKNGLDVPRPDGEWPAPLRPDKPEVVEPEVIEPGPDAKYAQALEFTRNKLARGEPIMPSKAGERKICGWCDEPIRKGAHIEEYEGQMMHPKCAIATREFNG